MNFLKRFLDYAIFSSALLLIFLVVFEQFLTIPGFVKWIGHWHPLVLHFPIVMILVTVIQYWRKDVYFDWFLSSTTIFSFITAITGFLLSMEGETKGDLILVHQWLGISVSFILGIWYWINQYDSLRIISPVILQGILVVLIVVTGHYGGMVTHGKDFLAISHKKDPSFALIPDNPIIYEHIIHPILEEKCLSCHNPNKSKGELMLSDYESIIKGGESGDIIDLEYPGNGLLLKNISSSMEVEGHMPPKEEVQLSEEELVLLSEWIENGASEIMELSDLEDASQTYTLVKQRIDQGRNSKWADLTEISESRLAELKTNYISIDRYFNQSNALQVIVYRHKGYNNSDLSSLKSISKNIIELNLSGLPVSEKEMDFVGNCANLEKLNISNTSLDNISINALTRLSRLTELKIYNTDLTDEAFGTISEIPNLLDLYAYNTNMSEEGIDELNESNPNLKIIKDAEEARDFKSVLPSPTIAPHTYFFTEAIKVKLNHPLEGINIYYTLDGSDPDETSDSSGDSLEISESLQLKYYAARTGWESSPMDSMRFFKTLRKPDNYSLTHSPNPRFTGRGEKLLFDLDKGVGIFGDSAWMAFREDNFILNCEWAETINIHSVVLSSVVNTDPYLFPPESITIRGGKDKSELHVLAKLMPEKLEERSGGYFEYYECRFDAVDVRFIEITVEPLKRIPMWHRGKGEKGWFFIDEAVFE